MKELFTNARKQDARRMGNKYGVDWQPDTGGNECGICRSRFGLLHRRHHCRKCGLLVCDNCSKWRQTFMAPGGEVKHNKRVCDHCRACKKPP